MVHLLLPNWTSYLLFVEDLFLIMIMISESKEEKKVVGVYCKRRLSAAFTLGSSLSILSISNLFKQLPWNTLDHGGWQDLREI